jgi:hypothetical protein
VTPGAENLERVPILSAYPPSVTTLPGGEARKLEVRLALSFPDEAESASGTEVRALGSDEIEVSCDAVTFGRTCVLGPWSFALAGERLEAERPVWVRSIASATAGRGELRLRDETTGAELVVPATADPQGSATDGVYVGLAVSDGTPLGVPVTAVMRGAAIVVRDRTRSIAPDGALVLDLSISAEQSTRDRHLTWLRPLGATDSAEGIVGTYRAGISALAPDTRELQIPLTITLPALSVEWMLHLTRDGEDRSACANDMDCGGDAVCPTELHSCVPRVVWVDSDVAVDNTFEDARSAAWWDAIDDLLGVGDAPTPSGLPAFATTGADLIETLMCTSKTSEAGAGRLDLREIRRGSEPSRSGDLACVDPEVPGAIGLLTRADRTGIAVAPVLLKDCLNDLTRPVSSDPTLNFGGASGGECANLARFLPALRLLATGERDKRTEASFDHRSRTLFARLVQQWGQLHGFIASTGLAEREYDAAIALTPDEGEAKLLQLLDLEDAGWAALLDKRVAPLLPAAATWAPASDTDLENDYRWSKQPLLYWPFNAGADANRDLIRGVTLRPNRPISCQVTMCRPLAEDCKISESRNSIAQGFDCPGFAGGLPEAGPNLAITGNLSAVFNLDDPDGEIFRDMSGTVLATSTLVVARTDFALGNTLKVIHPIEGDTSGAQVEIVDFTGVGEFGGFTSFDGTSPARGTMLAVVRDAANMTYTLYAWTGGREPALRVVTRPYQHAVAGSLINPRNVLVGAGPRNSIPQWWAPFRASLPGFIDDLAIFDSILSQREFLRIATTRGFDETRREVWPTPLSVTPHPTQELTTPIGAVLLETQVAHLELLARLIDHLAYEDELACETGDPAARANVDAFVARIGRTLRQSVVIEGLVSSDLSPRAVDARQLLRAKRGQVMRRGSEIGSCHNPYGMIEGEVPLYFGSISPTTAEKEGFFAASAHLLGLAEQRARAASEALEAVRRSWDLARQSEIQQLASDTTRNIRVDETIRKYGDGLRRLCGITDRTGEQVLDAFSSGALSADICFVQPTEACLAAHASGVILEIDPTCYRGVIGSALMDLRTAYHAQQAAYQNWQAAAGNAASAGRLCILEEMDKFGCSALDDHELSGVTCSPNHQGTLELIAAYNNELDAAEESESWFNAITSTVAAVGVAVATGGVGGAAIIVAQLKRTGEFLESEKKRSESARARNHEEVLQRRAAEADIRKCWSGAEQYQRAIAAANEASQQATAAMQAAGVSLQNSLGEAREIVLEAPIVIERERSRASLPIAFHYWLPQHIENYRFMLDSARRYAYMALRATEYDALTVYDQSSPDRPLRSSVLRARRPDTLIQQLALMRDQTNTGLTEAGPPKLSHVTFDLGERFFGLDESSPEFGQALLDYSRPVYSARGEYLGLGIAFSLLPKRPDEAPTWRCAERIWRVNVGSAGYPSGGGDRFHLKLLKRNVFASRRCGGNGLQASRLRPGVNLLVAAGELQTYREEAKNSVADISVVRLDAPNALSDFRQRDDAFNASSTELSLQGLYGDYVLLFPASALASGLELGALFDFNLRFDFLSIDDTPETGIGTAPTAGKQPDVLAKPGTTLRIHSKEPRAVQRRALPNCQIKLNEVSGDVVL